MSAVISQQVERILTKHQAIVGARLGDHRCSCGEWDYHIGTPYHAAHVAELILQTICDAAWLEGYRHGYESPDMPADFNPLSPYSADRVPGDYQWSTE